MKDRWMSEERKVKISSEKKSPFWLSVAINAIKDNIDKTVILTLKTRKKTILVDTFFH